MNGGIGIVNEMKAARADEDWVVKMLLRIILLRSCFQVRSRAPAGPPSARPSPSRYPKARGSDSCQVRLLLYPELILFLSLKPANSYDNKLGR